MTGSRLRLARSVVHCALLVGAAGAVASFWEALGHVGDGNAGWGRAFVVSASVTMIAAFAWVGLTIQSVTADLASVWRGSRIVALITSVLAGVVGILLNAFVQRRFEDEPVERWLFFSLAWPLACFLLIRMARGITRAVVAAPSDDRKVNKLEDDK